MSMQIGFAPKHGQHESGAVRCNILILSISDSHMTPVKHESGAIKHTWSYFHVFSFFFLKKLKKNDDFHHAPFSFLSFSTNSTTSISMHGFFQCWLIVLAQQKSACMDFFGNIGVHISSLPVPFISFVVFKISFWVHHIRTIIHPCMVLV